MRFGLAAMDPSLDTVYIVDDDSLIRAALTVALTSNGYNVICFAHGAALLSTPRTPAPFCVVLDLYLPGSSGLSVLEALDPTTYPAPVLLMSGHSCVVASAVAAMKVGAYDFIEKPFSGDELAERIESARHRFDRLKNIVGAKPVDPASHDDHKMLTSREQEVLTEWVAGATTKEIARKFGVSPRTIDIHRSKIKKKLRAKNSAETVRIAVSNQEASVSVSRRQG
jgi:FixJ family two-component response regulator